MAMKRIAGRTTPYGLWRYGDDFRKAANYILIYEHSKYFMPLYFLLGQSIELSLKAFLLARGTALADLRGKQYGHDLIKIVEECRRRRIGKYVKLTNLEVGALRILNLTYKPRQLQYIETGTMHLPEVQIIHGIAEKLSAGLEAHCHKATEW